MSAAQRSYPILINTIHGAGYLIGKDPANAQVCVQFTRKQCTDTEMLARYKGSNWAILIPESDLIEERKVVIQ